MFNLFNISGSKELIPLALVALAGVAIWYLWKKSQAEAAQANVAASTSDLTSSASIENLALLSALFGGTGAQSGTGSAGQVTVTPGGAPNAPAAAPVTTSSSIAPTSPGSSA